MILNLNFLSADFFQFLAACCQANAMKKMPDKDNDADYTPPDFMNNKTWLDFTKVNIFFCFYKFYMLKYIRHFLPSSNNFFY